jgi:fumarate reductase flavoprotein subunit
MGVLPADSVTFDVNVPVVIVGGGACGMVAALRARDAGAEALIIERDATPSGSTALSSGMIPACGTRFQAAKGVEDSVEVMAADVQRKNKNQADPEIVEAICRASGPAIDWLAERHGVALALVEGFLYPGHSCLRMHAPPSKTGAALIGNLMQSAEAAGVDLLTNARVTDLYADAERRVAGLGFERPDGSIEKLGCDTLVLACNGFGGNPEMVARYIPEMSEAEYFGHVGNTGDAVLWGETLGAAVRHMGAYQGHGSVAQPQRILITWALMMEGGIQVNAEGKRFSNEHGGYSEQSVAVLEQPGGVAWNIYDGRLHELGMTFEDYRQAEAAGAIKSATNAQALAELVGLPGEALAGTLSEVESLARGNAKDSFGRDFTAKPTLAPPYYAVKVTGTLFHTQGGLVIDTNARVLRADGRTLPNLFAGGGAACGISGSAVWGYLSGNGLLSAVTLGYIAGDQAARQALGPDGVER